jgi:hypothetical protein
MRLNAKLILRSSIKALLIIIITFLSAELSLRLYHYFNPVFVFPSNSYDRFRRKPFSPDYTFRLNSKGFKDIEFNKEKEPGAYRILGIGDSFTFGVVPYEDNYLTLLENMLNSPTDGQRYEVINMGIAGGALDHYLAILLREGLELGPDLVLLSIFLGNDLIETDKHQTVTSYVVSLMRLLWQVPELLEARPINPWTTYEDDQPTFSYDRFLDIEVARAAIYRLKNPDTEKWVRNAVKYVNEIERICVFKRIRLLIVLIPDELQIDGGLQRAVIEKLKVTPLDMDFSLPNKMLSLELDQAGISYVDLLEPIRLVSSHTRLYKPYDTHWNIAGNRLAAEIIYNYMVTRAERFEALDTRR